jgi:two-component system response regulator FlrC
MTSTKRILLVEDQYEERTALSDTLEGWGFQVSAVSDGEKALDRFESGTFDLVLTDLKMPKMDGIDLLKRVKTKCPDVAVILMSGYGTVDFAVEAMRLGAFDFIVKPLVVKRVESTVKRAVANSTVPREEDSPGFHVQSIITCNPQLLKLLELARDIADSKAPVFIQGESGTGKELFARYVHHIRKAGKGPFVAFNCAALPDGLLESELFGHEKGSFTGAISRKRGKFELANGGTIVLDEISEMNINLQAKLLRVLQESEVDRIGGQDPVAIDVRVMATTNQDIEAAVKAGRFRADLYYRLNVVPLKLPPLRSRREDIPLLVQHFIDKYNKIDGRQVEGVTEDALRTLSQMEWPGNVRELENVVERAVLLCKGRRIEKADLFYMEDPPANHGPSISVTGSLKEMEKKMIFQVLGETDGNRTHAADILGISVRTLRNKLNEYRQSMNAL